VKKAVDLTECPNNQRELSLIAAKHDQIWKIHDVWQRDRKATWMAM
jgi:hypothetical protein